MCAVIAGLATGCAAVWFTQLRLFPQKSEAAEAPLSFVRK
jgi:hypothetical protein